MKGNGRQLEGKSTTMKERERERGRESSRNMKGNGKEMKRKR